MNPAIWVAIIGAIATVMVGFLETIRRSVKPVSNGFTKHVMDALADIQATQGAHGAQLEILDRRVERVESKTEIWDRRKW